MVAVSPTKLGGHGVSRAVAPLQSDGFSVQYGSASENARLAAVRDSHVEIDSVPVQWTCFVLPRAKYLSSDQQMVASY